MVDASVPASEENSDNTAGVTTAAELFKSDATSNNAEVHHKFMMNQNAFIADASSNTDKDGNDSIRDESVDIGGDFFGRQLSAKGMSSFDLKKYGADTIARYHGGMIATLANKAMSLDPSLKRPDALSTLAYQVCILQILIFVCLSL